jgi:hypothetical protein
MSISVVRASQDSIRIMDELSREFTSFLKFTFFIFPKALECYNNSVIIQ